MKPVKQIYYIMSLLDKPPKKCEWCNRNFWSKTHPTICRPCRELNERIDYNTMWIVSLRSVLKRQKAPE